MDPYLTAVESAKSQGKITPAAAKNIADWLSQPRYLEYRGELIAHIERQDWKKLDDVFWTVIPFGTGGRRGRMYPSDRMRSTIEPSVKAPRGLRTTF